VDTKALVAIDPAEYTAFGLMNSHLYRARFLDIVSKNSLSAMEITMVIILCTAVRNKKRILTAMARFSSAAWYMKVRNFIIKKMVQYTSELDTTNTKFAVAIPGQPPLRGTLIEDNQGKTIAYGMERIMLGDHAYEPYVVFKQLDTKLNLMVAQNPREDTTYQLFRSADGCPKVCISSEATVTVS
jgi:hypothetical protein